MGWLALLVVVALAGCATGSQRRFDGVGGSGGAPEETASCGGQAEPAGWPDFSASDLEGALAFFASRERRFGQRSAAVSAAR